MASAVYDLLSFVKTEGVKSLIFYIVENYSDCLGNLQFVDVFEKLKIKYDQLMDYNSNSISNSLKQTDGQGIGLVRSSTLKRTKLLDLEEEEDYFFSEEEEEGEVGQGVSSRSGQGGELPAKAPRRLLDSSRRLLFGKKNNNNSNNNIDNGSAPFVAAGKARQSPSQSLLFGEGPVTMGGGRAIIFHRSGSQGANPVPNPTLIGSSSSSSGSSGIHNGASVDRFTARRASQSDSDSKSDISSLLSVYDEDEETETENMHGNENEAEIGTESSSGGRNGQESLIMPMLKFRPLKSVLSVPLEGQGDPSPHSELIFLPKKQEAKPLFDIFADDPDPAPSPSQSIAPSDRPMDSSADRGTLIEQSQLATEGFREGHADSCNSIMDTNITKEEGEEDDEDEDRREPELPPLKPKFESSDDDSDGPSVFTSLSHHHHHHNTTHNTTNNNNNNNNSQKVRIQIFKEKDNDQEKPSEITININNDNNNNNNNNTVNDNNSSIMNSDKKANHAAITFSIKKKPVSHYLLVLLTYFCQ